MSRCKGCDANMQFSPLFRKTPEGQQVLNDLCNQCTFISEMSEHIHDSSEYDMQFARDYKYVKTQL